MIVQESQAANVLNVRPRDFDNGFGFFVNARILK